MTPPASGDYSLRQGSLNALLKPPKGSLRKTSVSDHDFDRRYPLKPKILTKRKSSGKKKKGRRAYSLGERRKNSLEGGKRQNPHSAGGRRNREREHSEVALLLF